MASTKILNSVKNLFDKESPQTAKRRFKIRNWLSIIFAIAIFIILAVAFMRLMPAWMAETISAVIVVSIYFTFLNNRAIKIRCPNTECDGIIKSNTPWKCGNPKCHKDNEKADVFSFVDRCEHCETEQKAYKCHHCGEIIYFSEDKSKSLCATFVTNVVRKKSVPKKIADEIETIRKTEHELKKAKLNLELKIIKDELEPKKEKTHEEILRESVKDFKDRNMSGARIYAELMAENARIFKDDPDERERQDLLVKMWAQNNFDNLVQKKPRSDERGCE
jgi:hypothetical protein